MKCYWCDEAYREFRPGQATGCSSTYDAARRVISCGRGSIFNGREYKVNNYCLYDWLNDPGIILCDGCISSWVQWGDVVLMAEETVTGSPKPDVVKGEPMELVESKFVFQQENDCCDDGKHDYESGRQYLTVETHDGGGGVFVTIKTERWALDLADLETLVTTLRQIVDQVHSDVETV